MPFLAFALLAGIGFLPRYLVYRNSAYQKETGNGFWTTVLDKGRYGEFLSFVYLEKLPDHKKILANVYLPKEGKEETTEIDLIMIAETGIYVIESKNYSGFIYGNEKNKYWLQVLGKSQKNRFFNPIWQNKAHISALKNTLPDIQDEAYISYIVFSERCTLKDIKFFSSNVEVVPRQLLRKRVAENMKKRPTYFTVEQIDEIYSVLKRFSRVDAAVKEKHIADIEKKKAEIR
ncbi:nuclease-related domain-containing protein [Thermosyntropha sp.]|uniref:nuclease-related domain-containing protein n=1 Tax=Thermosyntropha sp. TaxID=2740820 RepID=UPI0025D661B3|nr:nuclease-related domain-containing protein [Thermosyntropha sp.]MBO8159680.1 NERD domain-containing protein [Thermosyntropha sp.]